MKAMEELKEMLEEELKKITKKGDITPTELENAYKAVDILKDIETIKAMQEAGGEDGGYSMRGNSYMMPYMYSMDDMSYNMSHRGSYDGMSHNSYGSYARAGRDGDGDGRYSEDGSYRRGRDARGRYTSRDGSYETGYSRHDKKEMMQNLQMMMQQAGSEKERKAIRDCIEELERA